MTIMKDWRLEYGFHGLIIRHTDMGHLCGYIGVPCEHPMYKVEYRQCILGCDFTEIPLWEGRLHKSWQCTQNWGDNALNHQSPEKVLDCHGGITFSGNELKSMVKNLWYFGFDCAHGGDNTALWSGAQRDEAYVQGGIESLYAQLANYVLIREA